MIDINLQEKIQKIRLVGTDIDGVWTDAKMYYTAEGDFMKAFSTYDGYGIQLLKEKGIEVAILTSENTPIVAQRAKKLGIKRVYLGEKEKLKRIKYLCEILGISINQVAYIGDDLNDLEVLKAVGLTAMPPNSPILHRFKPDLITNRKGGDGAFRDFVELILHGPS